MGSWVEYTGSPKNCLNEKKTIFDDINYLFKNVLNEEYEFKDPSDPSGEMMIFTNVFWINNEIQGDVIEIDCNNSDGQLNLSIMSKKPNQWLIDYK